MVNPPAGGLLSTMIEAFFVYALHNAARDKIYIGHTNNLRERIKRHNQVLPNHRKSYTSKHSGEWRLVYPEEYANRSDAIKREKQLKSFRGREFIRRLINN